MYVCWKNDNTGVLLIHPILTGPGSTNRSTVLLLLLLLLLLVLPSPQILQLTFPPFIPWPLMKPTITRKKEKKKKKKRISITGEEKKEKKKMTKRG